MIQDFTNHEINNFTENKEISTTLNLELFRCIFNFAGDAMFLADKETGQIIDVNPAAEKMYGYSKTEFINLKNSDLYAQPEITVYALNTEHNNDPVIYHKKKNGLVFPVEISSADFEQSGKILSVIIIRDITFNSETELRIIEKNKEMEQLIYITSHDFRTPLLNITGYSSELKEIFNKIKKIISSFYEIEKSSEISGYFNNDIPEALSYIDDSCIKINKLIENQIKDLRLLQVK